MGVPGQAVVKRREHWPFLYYQEGGRMYRNPIVKRKRDLTEYGDALM